MKYIVTSMVPETSERRSRQAEQMAAPANETAVRGPSGEPMISSDEREIRCRELWCGCYSYGAATMAWPPVRGGWINGSG